jgi:hypothetical protein
MGPINVFCWRRCRSSAFSQLIRGCNCSRQRLTKLQTKSYDNRHLVGQSVLVWSPYGARGKIFVTGRQLWLFRCGASSLQRGRVCHVPGPTVHTSSTSWMLIMLWCPLVCLLLTRPRWAMSRYAENHFEHRFQRRTVYTRSLKPLTWYLLVVLQLWRGDLCNRGRVRLLLLLFCCTILPRNAV